MGVIWHFLSLLSWLMRQSLWENGKNELGPRTLCLSVWPALSEAVDPQGPEGSAETFLTIRCLGRREWHSQGRYCSALFSTQLGPAHIIPSPHHSTPSQWQREKTTVKQYRADQACLLTSLSAKSTHTLQQAHTNPNNYQQKLDFAFNLQYMQTNSCTHLHTANLCSEIRYLNSIGCDAETQLKLTLFVLSKFAFLHLTGSESFNWSAKAVE